MTNTTTTISILGCGWLGRPLGAHLAAPGYRVNGSTTTPAKQAALRRDGIAPFVIRLNPTLDASEASDFFDADVLFLNIPPPRGHDDLRAFHLSQIRSVRDAAVEAGIGWVIFASSTGVYPQVDGVVTEDDAPAHPADVDAPMRETGRVLLAAERLLQDTAAFDTTILRFAGLYGDDRQPGRFLAGRTNAARPAAPVNLIHRDDCVGIVTCVIEQEARNAVYNACGDAHPTRRTLYIHEAKRLGLDPPTFTGDGGTNKTVSNARLKAQLGYTFQHPSPLG